MAFGGSLGAIFRFLISDFCKIYFNYFPFGTLFINFTGSFLIGILASKLEYQESLIPFIRYFLIIGFLGSFTTFSTFSLESIELINEKKYLFSLIYIFLSVFLCILGAYFGYFINRF